MEKHLFFIQKSNIYEFPDIFNLLIFSQRKTKVVKITHVYFQCNGALNSEAISKLFFG